MKPEQLCPKCGCFLSFLLPNCPACGHEKAEVGKTGTRYIDTDALRQSYQLYGGVATANAADSFAMHYNAASQSMTIKAYSRSGAASSTSHKVKGVYMGIGGQAVKIWESKEEKDGQ